MAYSVHRLTSMLLTHDAGLVLKDTAAAMDCGSFTTSNTLSFVPQHPGMNIIKCQQQELSLKQQHQQQQQQQQQQPLIRYNGVQQMSASSSECGLALGEAIVKEEPGTFEFTEKWHGARSYCRSPHG
ncbi:hypothetical protein LSAT2_008905 [Lamellibrachia satsuma]|nr:hypothetical protein LSAT2_008905 [Lamellibrachia satsuma]